MKFPGPCGPCLPDSASADETMPRQLCAQHWLGLASLAPSPRKDKERPAIRLSLKPFTRIALCIPML